MKAREYERQKRKTMKGKRKKERGGRREKKDKERWVKEGQGKGGYKWRRRWDTNEQIETLLKKISVITQIVIRRHLSNMYRYMQVLT